MSTDVRRRHVLKAAMTLFTAQGGVTTLEVKEFLRGSGMVAFQSDISYEMQNLSEELEWPFVWESEVEHPHRVYFSDLVSYEDSSADLLAMAEEATEESIEPSLEPGPHVNDDGEVELDQDFMYAGGIPPQEPHWLLTLDNDDSLKIFVTGVPLDRAFRNPLRIWYRKNYGGAYWNTVANHGGV